ncbi:unnamed protein product [Linum tenue]|nr:unnamed protein product [Linum tenue]
MTVSLIIFARKISFLSKYMAELGCEFEVYRNDELTVEELKRYTFYVCNMIIYLVRCESPRILEYVCKTVLELGPIVPLFCVCMGLQCFGEAFGGKIVRSPFGSMHGKSSPVYYDEKGKGLFTGLPKHGVQFHPESIITSEGKIIVQNFLKMIEEKEAESTN